MESKKELLHALKAIEKWEVDQKGLWFWERLSRLPFRLLDKVTPQFVHQKIGVLLDELGGYIQTGGSYLTNEMNMFEMIEQESGNKIQGYYDIQQLPLQKMETIGKQMMKKRAGIAAIQGATTGVGGIFTLAADIPALLGLSLKTLQDIAIIHGFNPNDQQERIFIVKCLQFSAADIVGKQALLKELSYLERENKSAEMVSQLQGWREVVATYRDQFGWKKLLQMVPIAGMIFGAFTNRSAIQNVGEAGMMLYRKRRIMARLRDETFEKEPVL